MSSITATDGVLDTLEVQDLRVFSNVTNLVWSGNNKHSNISLLNSGATAKINLYQSGTYAVLTNIGYQIGTNQQVWSLEVLLPGTIRVGMAEITRDLSSDTENNDHVWKEIVAVVGEIIVLTLTLTKLTIERVNATYTIDMTPHNTKTMYPWLSGTAVSGLSVHIREYRYMNVTINNDNVAQITTTTSNDLSTPLLINTGVEALDIGKASFGIGDITTSVGVDFFMVSGVSGTGLTIVDIDGTITIDSKLMVNSIEHRTSGPMTLKGTPNTINAVLLDSVGNFTVDPGDITASNVSAPAGEPIVLTSNSGTGIHISASGIISFDTDPKTDVVQSAIGTNLNLLEGSSLRGIVVKDVTGAVVVNSGYTTVNDITTSTLLDIGSTTQTQLNIGRSGIVTEVKGSLNVTGNVNVTGNITTTGTVDEFTLANVMNGVVTVHSDVSDAGSGAIITAAERKQIATNAANASGSVTIHSDITSAGSGAIITSGERSQISTNNTNATGSVTIHSDVSDAGSGKIITAAERIQITTNNTNVTGTVKTHRDLKLTNTVNNNLLSYSNGFWNNKTITGSGITPLSHSHVAANITDFNTEVLARITAQRGNANGICPLDAGGKIPAVNLDLSIFTLCGGWNASTNDPTLSSGAGTTGCMYICTADGSTNLDGITDWVVDDWAIFNGTTWDKIDNTDLVTSVAGRTGAIVLKALDLTDITSVGSGIIISNTERTQIGTNNTNATGSVTIHNDVSSAGSGIIISTAERAQIAANTAAFASATVHSDIISVGSGSIITNAERAAISAGYGGTATIHNDITDVGSGAIITTLERKQIGINTANNIGSVTVHSDVSSAGSGAIITAAERTQISTNTTNSTGPVTIHSDVTSAGSGAIITAAERTAIGTNTSTLALKLNLTGGTMTGDINMGDNNITGIANQTILNTFILGVTVGGPVDRKIKANQGNDLVLENFSASNVISINNSADIKVTGKANLINTTESTSISTGSLVSSGGIATAKSVTVGGLTNLIHQGSAPNAPPTDGGYLYVRNSTLYFMADNGTERVVNIT